MNVFAMQILPGSDEKSLFQKLICLLILSMILSWFKTFMSDTVLTWKPRIVACVTGVYPNQIKSHCRGGPAASL